MTDRLALLIRRLPKYSVEVAWLDELKTWQVSAWRGPTRAAMLHFHATNADLDLACKSVVDQALGRTKPPEPEPPAPEPEQGDIDGWGGVRKALEGE